MLKVYPGALIRRKEDNRILLCVIAENKLSDDDRWLMWDFCPPSGQLNNWLICDNRMKKECQGMPLKYLSEAIYEVVE